MGNLKKLPKGPLTGPFPGDTFNALIDGENRDRQKAGNMFPPDAPGARSSVVVRLVWQGEDDLPPGSVVALGSVLFEPDDSPEAPFRGLQFNCNAPTGDGDKLAITKCPIPAGGAGYGHVRQAAWAKVNVTDADHEFAEAVEDETVLQSADSGEFTILWKESGTGEKWAVVLLGGGGVSAFRWAEIVTTVTAGTWAGPGSGTVQYKRKSGGAMVNDGPAVTVANWWPREFLAGWYAKVDPSADPPEILVATCVPA